MEAGTFWRREPDVKFSLDARSEQRMVAVPTGIEHAREIRKDLGVLRRQGKETVWNWFTHVAAGWTFTKDPLRHVCW